VSRRETPASVTFPSYDEGAPGPQKLGTGGTLIFATMSYPGSWAAAEQRLDFKDSTGATKTILWQSEEVGGRSR